MTLNNILIKTPSPRKNEQDDNKNQRNPFLTSTGNVHKRNHDHDYLPMTPLNQIPIRKMFLSEFEISEDDKIFDELKNNNGPDCQNGILPIVSITKQNLKLKRYSNKKSANSLGSMNQTKLDDLYKFDTATKSLFKAKKRKKELNLYQYQTSLLDSIENVICQNNFHALKRRFAKIRSECCTKYDTIYPFLEEIEKKEREVIKKVNTADQYFERMLKTQSCNIGWRKKKLKKINYIEIFKDERKKKVKWI